MAERDRTGDHRGSPVQEWRNPARKFGGVELEVLNMKAAILSTFCLVALFGPAFHQNSAAGVNLEGERDQKLFLEGAKAISEGQFDKGRILLMSMIYTYPDSPLL